MHSYARPLMVLSVIAVSSLVTAKLSASNAPAAAPPAAVLTGALARADAALTSAELTAYRGWIKYLRTDAGTAITRHGAARTEAREAARRLGDWVQRITANPNLLATLSGVQECAYESRADDSGQPFKMTGRCPSSTTVARSPGSASWVAR
jgi:hypothetical protein